MADGRRTETLRSTEGGGVGRLDRWGLLRRRSGHQCVPAALLGQNTEAMLMDVAGLSRSELSGLRTWQSSQLSRRSDLFAASR